MKRYISLSCILLILVTCLASPVAAAEFEHTNYINILDICSADNSGANSSGVWGEKTYLFDFTSDRVKLSYVDMLIHCDGGQPEVTFLHSSGSIKSMTILPIGGGYYRVYGDLGGWYWTEFNINVKFDNGSDFSSWCSFLSIKAFSEFPNNQLIEAYCEISSAEYNGTIHYVPSDEVNYRMFPTASDVTENYFTAYIWTEDWKKYDYIDFQLMLQCWEITSVNCIMGQTNVPLDVSIFDGTNIDGNSYFISMSLDCSALDRTSSDYPMITIMGRLDTDSVNSIDFVNCSGGLFYNTDSSLLQLLRNMHNSMVNGFTRIESHINHYISLVLVPAVQAQTDSIVQWFTYVNNNVYNGLESVRATVESQIVMMRNELLGYTDRLEAAIRGDTSPGDSFQQEVNQKDQQLNNMAVVMESVDQPDLNSVNVSANSYVDSTVLAASMSGITSVFSQGLYFDVILMSIMMATAGYVLFGKR